LHERRSTVFTGPRTAATELVARHTVRDSGKVTAMPIETFDDLQRLRDDETPKDATLEALYGLYYSADATSPSGIDRFLEELRERLGRVSRPPADDEAETVLGVLTTEINDNHGGSPATFAYSFLLASGWLSAEVFSDATDLFREQTWLDEATGNFYDANGNWYDAEGNLIAPDQPRTTADGRHLWKDEASGLYYDAEGRWYDAEARPVAGEATLVAEATLVDTPTEDADASEDAAWEQAAADLRAILLSELTPDEIDELTDEDIADVLAAALSDSSVDV
jgi:hypothetical protein